MPPASRHLGLAKSVLKGFDLKTAAKVFYFFSFRAQHQSHKTQNQGKYNTPATPNKSFKQSTRPKHSPSQGLEVPTKKRQRPDLVHPGQQPSRLQGRHQQQASWYTLLGTSFAWSSFGHGACTSFSLLAKLYIILVSSCSQVSNIRPKEELSTKWVFWGHLYHHWAILQSYSRSSSKWVQWHSLCSTLSLCLSPRSAYISEEWHSKTL